jgi:hypothetical protein
VIRALVFLLALAPGLAAAQGCDRPAAIRFAPGTNSGVVEGGVVRGDRDCFTITARAGQRMRVEITSVETNAGFQLYLPGWRLSRDADRILNVDGKPLPGAGDGEDAMRWSGTLAAGGAHLIVVGGTRGNTSYRLTVTIQ